MKLIACFAAIAALTASSATLCMGEIADVTVIDRDSGARLTPHYYHGEYWVAGRPGGKYAIEIRNHLGERVLAVTSVDGVNVISGQSASWTQSGYVLNPGEHYAITGWRKSDSEVAAFTFTASPNSYAARTGRPANIGVIGVALFRERQPQPVYTPPPAQIEEAVVEPAEDASLARQRDMPSTPAPEPAQAPRAPKGPTSSAASAPAQDSTAGVARADSFLKRRLAEPRLGTGHGAREDSFVVNVEFERLQPQPNEILKVRYDSLDNLIAMGIIEHPRKFATVSDPFPASPDSQYVPDPPGGS